MLNSVRYIKNIDKLYSGAEQEFEYNCRACAEQRQCCYSGKLFVNFE
jgi:hypothetical protein